MSKELERVRLDRWLWAARFFKSRAMAKSAIEGGKVEVDNQRAKPAKEISIGQKLNIRRGDELFDVEVIALAYTETEASLHRRAEDATRRKMERAGLRVPNKRPEKRDRAALALLKKAD